MRKVKKPNIKIIAIKQIAGKRSKSRRDFQEEIAHLEKQKFLEAINKNKEEQFEIVEKQKNEKKEVRLEEELRKVSSSIPKDSEIEQRKEERGKSQRLYATGNDESNNNYRILPKNPNENYSSDPSMNSDQKTYTTDTQIRRDEYKRLHEKEESPHRRYKTH